MKTKRKTIKKNDSISYNDLEQYGLGSWLKENAGVVGTVAGAGLGMAVGMPMLGASIGGGIGGGVQRNAEQTDAINSQNAIITQQNTKTQAQGQLNNMLTNNPVQSYIPVARKGGRLQKLVDGGPLTNTVELTPNQRAVTDKLKKYQGTLTGVLANKTKGLYNVDSILNANAAKPNFNRANIRGYADEIIKDQGDYALTPEEIKKALGNDYDDYISSYDKYNKSISNYSGLVDTKGTVEKAPDIASQNFGARQMIERFPWSKEEGTPYTYLKDKLPKKAMGGTLNYNGQLHEGPDGGNPVDEKGNINLVNPSALVQKGEVGYNTEDGSTYIFSNDLYLDKKKTFAREAKTIQSKYKVRLGKNMIEKHDALASKGYNKDMKDLLGKQEQLREAKGIVDNTKEMRKGGKLTKYEYGDLLPITPNLNYQIPNSIELPTGSQINTALQPSANTASVEGEWKPDTGMDWQSAASLAAPIVGAITNRLTRKRPTKIKLDESGPTPQGINLERERAADREQANLSRVNIKRALKSGTSAQQYQANVGAAEIGVQRGLGQQLGESYQKEEAYNSGLSQQESARSDQRNQSKLQTDLYNTSLESQYDAQKQDDITGVINAANMYGRDVLQSKRDMNYLQMLDPRYKVMSRRRKWYSPKEQKVQINNDNII